jgi:chemotaxis protein CheD
MQLTATRTIPPPKKSLIVGVAEMQISNDPGADLVTYSLGSCIGIAVYDPDKKIGGLLHVMLPDSNIHQAKAALWPSMFVNTGVPRLFHALYNLGADRSRLVISAAGGAQFLDTAEVFNIGARNQQALLQLLARNGFSLQASDLGGVSSRTLRLDLNTGRVQIQTPGVTPYYL